MTTVWELLDALQRPLSSTAWTFLGPVKRLAVICRRFLWLCAVSFVQDAQGLPILASYASDGTPIRTRFRATVPSGAQIVPGIPEGSKSSEGEPH